MPELAKFVKPFRCKALNLLLLEMADLPKLTKSFLDRGEKCHTLTHAIRVGDYYSVIIFFQHGVELNINHSSKSYHNIVLFTMYGVSRVIKPTGCNVFCMLYLHLT